jgi:hypothetical protein
MKLCSDCRSTPWPYLVVVFIASFTTFLTWLTLATTGMSQDAIGWASAGVFLGTGFGLLGYIRACLRRHCHHGVEGHTHA